MEVSVVIPAYNEAENIAQLLESLENQDYRDFEVIVVDNGSSDQTAVIAKSLGAKVITEPRRGVAFARQAGFLAAQGKIIASTDADTILPKAWLSRIVSEFEKNPALAAFGGLYSLHSGTRFARIVLPRVTYPMWLADKYLNKGWSLPGANMAVRKSAFLAVGGFNTEFQIGEDAELSQRLRSIGAVILDKNFTVSTSGRRYRKGLIRGIATYAPNFINRGFLKKETKGELSIVREEKTSWRAELAPVLVGILFLLLMAHRTVRAESGKFQTVKSRMLIRAEKIYNSRNSWDFDHDGNGKTAI